MGDEELHEQRPLLALEGSPQNFDWRTCGFVFFFYIHLTGKLRIDRKVDFTVWDEAYLLAAGDGIDLKSQLVGEPDL